MSELVIGQPLESQFFSSKRRNRESQRVGFTPRTSEQPKPPSFPRRTLLKVLGGVAATAAAGGGVKLGIDKLHYDQQEGSYQGWEKYQNRALPQSLIVQIGQNIEASDYPGFSEVGKVIQRSQTDFASLDQFYPRLTKPVVVGMTNLVKQIGALAEFQNDVQGIGVEVDIKDKKTGVEQKPVLVDPTAINTSEVLLENTLWAGSSMAKRMLLVKEFSHLLYMNQFKQILLDDITNRFDVSTTAKAPLADLLVMTAYLYGDPRKPSPFGYNYDNARTLVDYAGYWHIMPAMGVAMEQAALSDEDLSVMYSDKNSFDLAKARGYLTEPSKGNFVWREGITPFSKEWQDLMKVTF